MKNQLMLAVLATALLVGCSKEETINPPPPPPGPAIENIPLAVGNYWIYETYRIDTLGNETLQTGLDSIYLSHQTTHNGHTYFVVGGGNIASHIYGGVIRNQGNEVLNVNLSTSEETIIFKRDNRGVVFKADTFTSGPLSFAMTSTTLPALTSKTTTSGSYNCFELNILSQQFLPAGTYPLRTEKRFYESTVGVIAGQYFYVSSPDVFELRLVRYHLN